jgi:drug/metabolite transporter (DMT)-like permease
MSSLSQKLQLLADKLGHDNSAYLCWVIASILWNVAFIYPTEHGIGSNASNLNRGLAMFLINGIGLYWRPILSRTSSPFIDMTPGDASSIILRHVLLALYGYGFAEGQFYLPSPVIYTIYFSGPLFVILFEYFFYGVEINLRKARGIVLAGVGVLLTSNGQLIWAWITNDNTIHTTFKQYRTESFVAKSLASLVMVALSFGWAYSILIMRKIKAYTHWTVNFNYGVVMSIVAGFTYSILKDKVIE